MVYVLDANVIIHYLKEHDGVKKHLRQAVYNGCELFVPRVVDYEVRRGLELLSATKKAAVYSTLLDPAGQCKIVDMGECVWEFAKQIYVSLKRMGFTVGEIDIIIGAYCLQHDYTLVTSNVKDFKNMNGLKILNWWV